MSSPAVTIYERDACFDLARGRSLPLVEFCCPELDVTFNFVDKGTLRVWEGVASSHLVVARHHRPGPALTDAQAVALRRVLKLKAKLAEAEAAANDAFGTEFRLLVSRDTTD